jgi:hypothetical protein
MDATTFCMQIAQRVTQGGLLFAQSSDLARQFG